MAEKTKGWWEDFFTRWRPQKIMLEKKTTNLMVRYLIDKLNLKKGSKFLDCPCGFGRISIPMAQKGIKVTGVDITPHYLAELREKADRIKLPMKLYHNDMRKINFDSEFDAVANLWTSFGYFDSESDNLAVIKKAFKALKPGGKFIIQMINRDWILKNFLSHGWLKEDDYYIVEDRVFDFKTSTMIMKWTYLQDGKTDDYDSKIRMYSYHELYQMFEKTGFVNIEGFGNTDDEPISNNSREIFIIGQRPEK